MKIVCWALFSVLCAGTGAQTLVYDVTIDQAGNPAYNVSAEVDRVIRERRLSGASKEIAENNRVPLTEAFREIVTGYHRTGQLTLSRASGSEFLRSFAPVLGGGTSPTYQYYNGVVTISAGGPIGERHANSVWVRNGDHRRELMNPAERIVFWGDDPGALSKGVGSDSETFWETSIQDRVCITTLGPKSEVIRSKTYLVQSDRRLLITDIAVNDHTSHEGTSYPSLVVAEFYDHEGENVRTQTYRLVQITDESVDLSNFIPKGLPVVDLRFGATPATYAWDGRLPGNDEVEPVSSLAVGGFPRLGLTVFGFGSILLGVSLWMRTKARKGAKGGAIGGDSGETIISE